MLAYKSKNTILLLIKKPLESCVNTDFYQNMGNQFIKHQKLNINLAIFTDRVNYLYKHNS